MENTKCKVSKENLIEDHLHLRGEHLESLELARSEKGSPPLTWRTLIYFAFFSINFRITSTYVENTFKPTRRQGGGEDHLHLRGEHLFFSISLYNYIGSPPLTWRTLLGKYRKSGLLGITSTYVENTNASGVAIKML